jgi:hypothetical protein
VKCALAGCGDDSRGLKNGCAQNVRMAYTRWKNCAAQSGGTTNQRFARWPENTVAFVISSGDSSAKIEAAD